MLIIKGLAPAAHTLTVSNAVNVDYVSPSDESQDADKTLARPLGERGQRLVREKYSWNSKGQALENALRDVAASYSRTN